MPSTIKLTGKMEKFCRAYVKTFNATEAAKIAGYEGRTYIITKQIGHNLLQKPQVQARLKELFEESIEMIGLTKMEIVQGIKDLAFDKDVSPSVRLNALVKLGDYLQLFQQKQEIVIKKDPYLEMTDEELEEKIKELKDSDKDE